MVLRRFLWAGAMGRNFMVSLLSAAKIVSGENKEGGWSLRLAATGGHHKVVLKPLLRENADTVEATMAKLLCTWMLRVGHARAHNVSAILSLIIAADAKNVRPKKQLRDGVVKLGSLAWTQNCCP
jgi:hypothetical protein